MTPADIHDAQMLLTLVVVALCSYLGGMLVGIAWSERRHRDELQKLAAASRHAKDDLDELLRAVREALP